MSCKRGLKCVAVDNSKTHSGSSPLKRPLIDWKALITATALASLITLEFSYMIKSFEVC